MNGGIVTECPECETRFNVSEGQLKLADGKVRCGACLRVFDAKAHQPYSEPLRPPAEKTVPQRATPQQEYSLHVRYAQPPTPDSVSVTAPDTAGPVSADGPSFDPDAPLEVSSPAKAPQESQEPQHHDRHRAPPGTSSAPIPIASFLRAPVQETAPDASPEQPPEQPFEKAPEQTTVVPPGALDDPATADYEPQTVVEFPAAEEAGHEHEEPAHHRPQAEPELRPEPLSPDPEPAVEVAAAASASVHRPQEQPAPSGTQPEPATATEADRPPVQATTSWQTEPQPAPQSQGLAALQDLHAEPLQLTHPAEPAAPGAVLGWSLGCLAACVLLASQLAWFNRIEWSRQPALTEFYDILCHQVECAIPPHQAVELIHNRQLVVRTHPRFEDALSIDLLLENTADFHQPFPAIELSFSDIRGRTVARRVLQPRDYLDDALNPLKMARSQPFQVNLAILDPGRRAVSYEVQLAPARL